MEQSSTQRTSPRKLVRRRSHTRKASQDCIINIAEARREIVNALHLHRSTSSSCSSSSSSTPSSSFSSTSPAASSPSWSSCCCVSARNPKRVGVSFKPCSRKCNISNTQHSPSVMEPLPLPQPTWSTTSPSIIPMQPIEEHELGWNDNLNAYNWWLEFLKNLDKKNDKLPRDPTCPFAEETEMDYLKQFSMFIDASKLGEASSMVVADQSLLAEDWLTIPNDNSFDSRNP